MKKLLPILLLLLFASTSHAFNFNWFGSGDHKTHRNRPVIDFGFYSNLPAVPEKPRDPLIPLDPTVPYTPIIPGTPITPQPVPESATIMLLGLGLLVMASTVKCRDWRS
jgi:hypothetical protein